LIRQSARYILELYRYHRQRHGNAGIRNRDDYARTKELLPATFKHWDDELKNHGRVKKYPHISVWPELKPFEKDTAATEEQIAGIARSLEDEARALLDQQARGEKLEKSEAEMLQHLKRHPCRADFNRMADDAVKQEVQVLRDGVAKMKSELRPPPTAHVLSESGSGNMHVAIRGDLRKKGDLVPRRFFQILTGDEPRPFENGSGRGELADAVVAMENPLTARVMVNRVWMWHTGRALVRSPSNFGALGEKPTHPRLLDWLAAEFMEKNWSLKQLHRTILLSSTWQMSSAFDQKHFDRDGDNRLLWRMNPRRLEVEVWRDSLLAVTGELNRELGGRPSNELFKSHRRTLYATVSRNGDKFVSDEWLRLFDFPAPRVSSAGRVVSTVPQQYLFMMNSPFMSDRARALHQRVANAGTSDEHRIERMYRLLYNRGPSPEERAIGLRFLQAPGEGPPQWEQYAHVLLSAEEFRHVE
ncbi:MAG: DUF1553 domain-containing protein, partial [Verrucomicrobiota bacterium]